MYQRLKSLVKQLIPKQLLFQLEPLLRQLLSFFYWGKKHQCPICGAHLSRFIPLDSGDRLCPRCGSIDRNRRLWLVLQEQQLLQGRLLHFSPPRPLYRRLKNRAQLDYVATDYADEFVADHRFDITSLDGPDDHFDTIICFHVLEHVLDDQRAMLELFRVLKPGGQLLLQTPFKEGEIYENVKITSPEERLAHFGQEDHVRIYSVSGLKGRLEAAGFQVQVQHYSGDASKDQYYGLKTDEYILVATS